MSCVCWGWGARWGGEEVLASLLHILLYNMMIGEGEHDLSGSFYHMSAFFSSIGNRLEAQ